MTALAVWPRHDPRNALWHQLRMADDPVEGMFLLGWAANDCSDGSLTRGQTLHHLESILNEWVDQGLVLVVSDGPSTYALSPDHRMKKKPRRARSASNARPSSRDSQRQRLWTAMRILRRFDLPTLLMTANASRRATTDLIAILERGGWLSRTGSGWATSARRPWGPHAPSIARVVADEGRFLRITDRCGGCVVDLPIRSARRHPRRELAAAALSDGGVS